MSDKRPYVKVAVDWTDEVLREWAEQVRTKPRSNVLVTPGGQMPSNMLYGGPEPMDRASGRGVTARGTQSRRYNESREPMGHVVKGLEGRAGKADTVLLYISGVDARCAWAIRAEYGLVPEVQPNSDAKAKGATLGVYLDGRVWPASAYMDRLSRGLQMFAVGYLCGG